VVLVAIGSIVYVQLRAQINDKLDAALIAATKQLAPSSELSYRYEQQKSAPAGSGGLASAPADHTDRPVAGPGVIVLLWDEQGMPYPASLADAGHERFYLKFGAYQSVERPATLFIDGHYYRTFFLALSSPLLLHRSFKPPVAGAEPGILAGPRTAAGRENVAESGSVVESGDVSEPDAAGGHGMERPHIAVKPGLSAEPETAVETDEAFRADAESASFIPIRYVQAIVNMDAEQNLLNKLADGFLIGLILGGMLTVLAGLYLANQALRPIRRSWEQQRRFAADASHELRMPLSIIQANAELMLRHPDRSVLEISEQISMVLAETKRMAKLTDQLLLLARSDSGQEELRLGPVRLEPLIRHVVQLFAPLAELNGVRLAAEIPYDIELQGDRDKLQQLLVILLDNSLNHTLASGTIRVALNRRGQQAIIIVEDTGAGIAAADLPHIFDRFYRGGHRSRRRSEGTGLGLAIAHWIAERHGGTIAAASKLGRGTTMTVRLPIVSVKKNPSSAWPAAVASDQAQATLDERWFAKRVFFNMAEYYEWRKTRQKTSVAKVRIV